MEIFEQNELTIYGNGKIIYEHHQGEAHFELEYNPFSIILKTSRIILGQLFSMNYGKFEGLITDSQIKVECKSICLTKYSKYQLTFVLLDDLVIGNESDFRIFKARIFGLNHNIEEFKIDDYIVSVKKIENFDSIDSFNKKYGQILESSELIIKDKNSNILNKESTIKISKDICLILSFILAKNVVYNRCEFFDNDNQSQKIIKINLITNSQGKRFIYEENLGELISTLYENFIKMEENEKKCLFTSIDYLNSVSSKFLEDSILSIAQVWEILADTFLKEKINNTESINLLRTEMKNTVNKWHNENEIKDYDIDFIKNRVLESLDWEKVIKKLEKLAENENINSEKIGLNFKELISLRNQIAHSGRFKEVGREIEYSEIYSSAILGVKVLILNKLGYKGNITYFIGGIPTTKNIDYYIN